jgi:exodeoxyribonuclease III
MLKLISWNVNGIRAALRKDAFAFLLKEKPDVLCLQETRAVPEDVGDFLPALPYKAWNPAQRPGYSGTTVFSRHAPLSVRTGIGVKGHDGEGRVLTFELDNLFIVSVYTPNSQRQLARLPYRKIWDRAFLRFLRRLQENKPVIFCGDLNVAHEEIDLARPRENRGANGFTDQERSAFRAMLTEGFVDSFRALHAEGGQYTWWHQVSRARERNVGWRIDYVMISEALRPLLKKAFILPEVAGSDHCPVGIVLGSPSIARRS